MYRVVIDPGHGGYDSGAVGPDGLLEKDITLAVALKLATKLQQAGIEVRLTRNTDQTPWGPNNDLQMRCDIANSFGADLFISIHCNSSDNPSANGTETYAYKPAGHSEQLAMAVQKKLINALELTNRGVKYASYYVLRKTNMLAILVEIAFISNPQEEQLLAFDSFQELAAHAIADGITDYLGIRKENKAMPESIQEVDIPEEDKQRIMEEGLQVGLYTSPRNPNESVQWWELIAVGLNILRKAGKL